MKIIFKRTTPSYRNPLSTHKIMFDLTIGLGIICILAIGYNFSIGVNYGIKALLMILFSVAGTHVIESLYFYLTKQNIRKSMKNSFGYVTGILFALILPVGTPLYVVFVGSLFATLVGKLLFGGFGQNIFNPALVGRVFVMMSFGDKLTASLPSTVDAVTRATPTTALSSGNWITEPTVNLGNLFFGFYNGSIGETFAIAIILIGIWYVYKQVIDWRLPVFYVGTSFLIAFVVAMTQGLNPLVFALSQIAIGGLLFGAVFMLTDPVTSPTGPLGKIIFAVGAAFFTMLLRYKSNMPEGVLYSILIMNMLTPMIEKYTSVPTDKDENKKMGIVIGFIFASIILLVPIANASFGITYPKFKNETVAKAKEWCESDIVKSRNITCTFEENVKDTDKIGKDAIKPGVILKRNTNILFEIKK